MQPSEYWRSTPKEVWTVIESRRPKKVGGLSESDYDRICEREAELRAQGVKLLE